MKKLVALFVALCVSFSCFGQGAIIRGEVSPGIYENIKSKNQALVSGNFDYLYNNITALATTVIKTGSGFLHCITINNIGTTLVVTIYDNTSATVPKIGTTTALVGLGNMCYDIAFTTGLTIVTSGAVTGDITVSYR